MIGSLWIDRGSRSLDEALVDLLDVLTLTARDRELIKQAGVVAAMREAGIEVQDA